MGKLKELYKTIWDERPHKCEHCGHPICVSEPIAHNFAHIKSKGSRPDLKFDKDNIRILCSTWNRHDNRRGCHELEHTNPEKFKQRSIK